MTEYGSPDQLGIEKRSKIKIKSKSKNLDYEYVYEKVRKSRKSQ